MSIPKLPRCPRAAGLIVGLLLALLAADARAQSGDEQEPAEAEASAKKPDTALPMGPPDAYDRGTPRGTMEGFISATRDGDYDTAVNFLDLRRLSPRAREEAPELARQLKAVLDRKLWVDPATLSESSDGSSDDGLPSWQDRLGRIETPEGPATLLLQRVPRAEDGVRIWKVSSSTVARIEDLYELFGPAWLEGRLPPVFLEYEAFGVALWQWIGLVVAAFAGLAISLLVAGTLIRVLGALLGATGRRLDERVVAVVRGPVRLGLTLLVFTSIRRWLGLDPAVADLLAVLERVLWVGALSWLFFRLIDIATLVVRQRSEQQGNVSLLPLLVPLKRFAKASMAFVAFLALLGALGVNVTAAIAGLGVGGIAVALAAQKSLENLLGGVNLFADQPVRVGDFFRYGDQVGTVEDIGLRSTRVRTLDRTVVTIPNAEFSNLKLENFALRDRLRLWTMIGVRYETTPDQLRYVLARLREILLAHPRVMEDPARVRFVGFGAYSLDLEVFAYVDTSDWNEFLAIREEIYLLFMEAIGEAGTGFAFPSQTTYLGRDDGLSEEEISRAEERVREWREKGELPFPDPSEAKRREVWNTLAWPPKGSPGARGG